MMHQRFIAIWFKHLTTDWFAIRNPALREQAFVLAAPQRGRMVITAVNKLAQAQCMEVGMAIADARSIFPSLRVLDDKPELPVKLLKVLGEWCIRYTPITAMDPPDGLILNCSGCPHLWGGEMKYLKEMITRLTKRGYDVRGAMADTIGTAWAVARYGEIDPIIAPGEQMTALLPLPLAALRLEPSTLLRLQKLGLYKIRHIINISRASLRRRFGPDILLRLNQALGQHKEAIEPLQPIQPYQERLPCLEPIVTATGIEIALKQLLDSLCLRLQREGNGLRAATFMGYRVDGKMEQVEIGTNRASHSSSHLFKLFEGKIASIEPALGIELFVLETKKVEELDPVQEALWQERGGLEDAEVAELLDRIAGKIGSYRVHRYLPDAHYWPERSFKVASSMQEKPVIDWPLERPRPIRILARPERIDVTAPIPDYPPMLFRYQGKLHHIKKADGPERIEREWWLEGGEHRDYYCVEDEDGQRYWLFRSGHYDMDKQRAWFIHGFFA